MTVPLVVIVCAFEGLPTVAYAHQASYLLLTKNIVMKRREAARHMGSVSAC